MPTQTCSKCGAECEAGLPNCPECGGYLGRRRREPVYVPPPEPEPEDTFGLPGPLYWFLDLFPGLVSPKVVIMAIASTVLGGLIMLLAFILFTFGAMIAPFMIGGFGLICYWAAIAWLLNGYVCMPTDAMVDFDGRKWTAFWVLAMLPLSLLLLWLAVTD
jgi:hypothetical protein